MRAGSSIMQLACEMPGCTAFQACWSHDNSVSVPNDHLPPADQLDKLKDVAPPDFGSLRVSGSLPTVDTCACSYSVCLASCSICMLSLYLYRASSVKVCHLFSCQ